MNDEAILNLDKRLSMQEATVTRVLEAVERQANSTEKLNESVTKMTTSFDYLTEEVKDLKHQNEKLDEAVRLNTTEISVIKSSTKWQEWAGRALIVALVASVLYSIGIVNG